MRILIAVASRHGSTTEIAERLADRLAEAGHAPRVLDLVHARHLGDELDDLTSYDAYIVGSAIYEGHWLRQARTFVLRNAAHLQHAPVFLFSSGPIGDSEHVAIDLDQDRRAGARGRRRRAPPVLRSARTQRAGPDRALDRRRGPRQRRRLPRVGRDRRRGRVAHIATRLVRRPPTPLTGSTRSHGRVQLGNVGTHVARSPSPSSPTVSPTRGRPRNGRSIVVCDVRFSLADVEQGRREYDAGHLPGAVFVDLHTELAGGPGGGRHPLPIGRRLHAAARSPRHHARHPRGRLRQRRRRHGRSAVVDVAVDRPRPGRRARRRATGLGRGRSHAGSPPTCPARDADHLYPAAPEWTGIVAADDLAEGPASARR